MKEVPGSWLVVPLEASAGALAIAGGHMLAAVFAVLIAANAGLLYAWRQDELDAASAR